MVRRTCCYGESPIRVEETKKPRNLKATTQFLSTEHFHYFISLTIYNNSSSNVLNLAHFQVCLVCYINIIHPL